MFDIEKLLTKIRDRSALVGVVGLGYVGLPFAVEKGKAGFTVLGIEVDLDRAARVNRGENYIVDVDDAELKHLVQSGRITAVTDFSRISEVDVIVVCVPTPLTRNMTPDLQFIESVTHSVAPHLRPGQLVTLESTTYPGTTEEVMLPILEASGLKVEGDFYLAHSPERVDPGNPVFKTKNTAKVVGGVGPVSLQVATAFYGETLDNVFPVSCAKAAELSKVFENTFRAVNVGLVNELTVLCDKMGLNVWEVLDAAYTKPFGIMPFYPGPGVGGHCIPIDPHYLEWKAKEYYFETRFIATAGAINRVMPEFVRDKTLRILNANGVAAIHAKVVVLGAAYKKNIDDYRESPAIEVILRLADAGIEVCFHDPYVSTFTEHGITMESVPLTEELVRGADLVIITTDHSNIDYTWIVEKAKAVFDTRNATKAVVTGREKITLL